MVNYDMMDTSSNSRASHRGIQSDEPASSANVMGDENIGTAQGGGEASNIVPRALTSSVKRVTERDSDDEEDEPEAKSRGNDEEDMDFSDSSESTVSNFSSIDPPSYSDESLTEEDDNVEEWGTVNDNFNMIQRSSTSSKGTRHSGSISAHGSVVSWIADRVVAVAVPENGRRFLFSNTGSAQFQRVPNENNLRIVMDLITVTVQPRTGIQLDNIRVVMDEDGRLEIEIPN